MHNYGAWRIVCIHTSNTSVHNHNILINIPHDNTIYVNSDILEVGSFTGNKSVAHEHTVQYSHIVLNRTNRIHPWRFHLAIVLTSGSSISIFGC